LWLDYGWPLLRFPAVGLMLQTVRQQPVSPDVVFVGSSRFNDGIRPQEIAPLLEAEWQMDRPCFLLNLSSSASDPVAMDFCLKHLLAEGARPRLVVVEVAPDTLNGYHDFVHFHAHRQFHWGDLLGHLGETARSRGQLRVLRARLLPTYQFRHDLLEHLGDLIVRGQPRFPLHPRDRIAAAGAAARPPARIPVDWQAMLTPPAAEMTPALRQKQQRTASYSSRHYFRRYKIGGMRQEALERILRRCRQHGASVLLMEAPVSGAHRRYLTPEIDGTFRAYIDQLCHRHGCSFVAARAWMPDPLFSDCLHLDERGAVHFSRLLTHRVLRQRRMEVLRNLPVPPG
jgi:hypothetical protein